MRVLGVDPGSNATGYGLIEREGGKVRHLCHGVLRPPPGATLPIRLRFLYAEMLRVVDEGRPEIAVIEKVFVASNPRSALILGQARGALIASLGTAGLVVEELSAREVKKSVTGSGGAAKDQIQTMVTRLLKLEKKPATDAADALAIALTFAQAGALAGLPKRPGGGRRGHRRAMTEAYAGRTS